LPGVTSLQVEVLERGEQVVFLHRVAPGAADRSYGVHVARLAGVPEPVARRAAAILAELEQTRDAHDPGAVRSGPAASAPQLSAGAAEALRRLTTLEPLRMSPLEALSELIALADLAAGSGASDHVAVEAPSAP